MQCRAPEGKAAELPGRGERRLGWVSARRNGGKPRGSGDLGKLSAADAGELLEIYAEGTFVLQLVAHRFLIAQQTQPGPRRPAAVRLFGGKSLICIFPPPSGCPEFLKLLCAGEGSWRRGRPPRDLRERARRRGERENERFTRNPAPKGVQLTGARRFNYKPAENHREMNSSIF